MFPDYTIFLWLLTLGGALNLYFLTTTPLPGSGVDAYIVVPAQILFAVSAYRCFFPVRYEGNVVFHDSVFSSIFFTRLFATFSEIAFIFLFSHILRIFNLQQVVWITALSWLMVAQVVVSQGFVWVALLTGKLELYFYEELGWAFIFVMNTIASGHLYLAGEKHVLLQLNLFFGLLYLPWQVIHLISLRANATRNPGTAEAGSSVSAQLASGLKRAMRLKNRRTDAHSWAGVIGLIWMTSYWATLIPVWTYYIVRVLSPHR